MTPAQFQRLQAIKVQLDTLIAELGAEPVATPTTAPAAHASEPGFGKGRTVEHCDHPPKKRESITGFGAGPNRWRCGECGHTQEG